MLIATEICPAGSNLSGNQQLVDFAPSCAFRGVVFDFSRPSEPTDNAFIEAFSGRFRAECPNQHWFLTIADAAEKLEAWRRCYNEERPHGAIGNKVPIMLTKPGGVTSPSP